MNDATTRNKDVTQVVTKVVTQVATKRCKKLQKINNENNRNKTCYMIDKRKNLMITSKCLISNINISNKASI